MKDKIKQIILNNSSSNGDFGSVIENEDLDKIATDISNQLEHLVRQGEVQPMLLALIGEIDKRVQYVLEEKEGELQYYRSLKTHKKWKAHELNGMQLGMIDAKLIAMQTVKDKLDELSKQSA